MRSKRRGVSMTVGILAIAVVGIVVGAIGYYDGTSSGRTVWTSVVMKTDVATTATTVTTVTITSATATTTTTYYGTTEFVTVTNSTTA